MKFLRNLTSYAPMLAAVLVIACVANSLSGYVVPAYGVEQPEREKKEATATDEPQQMKETEPEETVTGSFDKEDGVYQGTGTGFRGEITASVTIKNRQIVSIDIVRTSDDETFFNRAKAVIHSILEKQNLDVDVVSGATFSSRGIINAVKNALTGESDSQEPASAATQSTGIGSVTVSKVEEPSSYKDGTYYGTGIGFGGPL